MKRVPLGIILLGAAALAAPQVAQAQRTLGSNPSSSQRQSAAQQSNGPDVAMCDRIFRDAYDRGARSVTNEINRFNAPCHNAGSGWPEYLDMIEQLDHMRISDGINAPEKMQLEWIKGRVPFLTARKGVPDLYGLEEKAIAALGGSADVTSRDQRLATQFDQNDGNPSTASARAGLASAKAGDPAAMYAYALRLARGDGVDRNESAANFWLKEAAHKRHSTAQAAYAWQMYRGAHMEQDHSKAHYWADLSAQQGDPMGYYVRGLLAWPMSSPTLFAQMVAENGLGGFFNFTNALADLDRAEAACGRAPYASNPNYESMCANIPNARTEIQRSLQGSGNPSDQDYRDQSQQIIDDYNANEQRINDFMNNAVAGGVF